MMQELSREAWVLGEVGGKQRLVRLLGMDLASSPPALVLEPCDCTLQEMVLLR